MEQHRSFIRAIAAAAATTAAAGAMTLASGPASASPPIFNPNAYLVSGAANGAAGNVTLSLSNQHTDLVNVPAVAPESMRSDCASPVVDGKTKHTTLAGVDVDGGSSNVVTESAVSDTGVEQLSATTIGVTEESRIEGLSLLDGSISANVIDAVAHTSKDAMGINNHLGTADSAPTGLTVAHLDVFGHEFDGNIPANTKVALSKSNYVILNEQKPGSNGVVVNAIDVHLAATGAFSGALTVGHAQSQVNPQPSGDLYFGAAYAANFIATTSTAHVDSGHYADATVKCTGGSASNSVASVGLGLPGAEAVGAGTAQASVEAGPSDSPSVVSNEDIQSVNLLGGAVTADALYVVSTTDNTAGLLSSTGSTTFVNLVVNGQPIAANPAPNTKITIPGLGVITLNKQTCAAGTPAACMATGHEQLFVTAISLRVTSASNAFNLPLSTTLDVAHAGSGLTTVN